MTRVFHDFNMPTPEDGAIRCYIPLDREVEIGDSHEGCDGVIVGWHLQGADTLVLVVQADLETWRYWCDE